MCVCFPFCFFSERTRPAASMSQPCLVFRSRSNLSPTFSSLSSSVCVVFFKIGDTIVERYRQAARTGLLSQVVQEGAAVFGALLLRCPLPVSGFRMISHSRQIDQIDHALDHLAPILRSTWSSEVLCRICTVQIQPCTHAKKSCVIQIDPTPENTISILRIV